MNKKITLIIVLMVLLVASIVVAKRQTLKPVQDGPKVHYHAGFIVFENGKKLNFSDSKYMLIKPCTVNGEEVGSPSDEQIEKAHLHDNVGDLVHIEASNAKWGDLLTNINFSVDYSKVTAYINGQATSNFQNLPINKDDSLVLFIGSVDEKMLSRGVTAQYIEEQAKKSGTCSD